MAAVEFDVRLRLDPAEPAHHGAVIIENVAGQPVLVVNNVDTVNLLYVGTLVVTLLDAAARDAETRRRYR